MMKNKYICWKTNIGIEQINTYDEKQIYMLKDKYRDWTDKYIWRKTYDINIYVKDIYRDWTNKCICWKSKIYYDRNIYKLKNKHILNTKYTNEIKIYMTGKLSKEWKLIYIYHDIKYIRHVDVNSVHDKT